MSLGLEVEVEMRVENLMGLSDAFDERRDLGRGCIPCSEDVVDSDDPTELEK